VPPVLYKYRHWNPNSRTVLENGQIWFSRPSDFNDPFDCQLRPRIPKAPQAIKTILRKKFEQAFPNLGPKEIKKKLNAACTANPKELRKFLVEFFRKRLAEDLKIFCLSEICDDLLMWSHYADSHRGLASDSLLNQSRSSLQYRCSTKTRIHR
jgi:hypothetical protein